MMALRLWVLTAGTLLCLLNAPAQAKDLEELLTKAATAYTQAQAQKSRAARLADYENSYRLFQQARKQLVEAKQAIPSALEINIGNASLGYEDLGSAILSYRRVLQIDPDHRAAKTNLRYARSLLPPQFPSPSSNSVVDTFLFWHSSLSTIEKYSAAAICFAIAGLLLALGIVLRRALLRNCAIVLFALWLALISSALLEHDPTQAAVVTAKELAAHSSDSSNSPTLFTEPLPAGLEVEIIKQREHWLRITLADGREAWVQRRGLTRVLE